MFCLQKVLHFIQRKALGKAMNQQRIPIHLGVQCAPLSGAEKTLGFLQGEPRCV